MMGSIVFLLVIYMASLMAEIMVDTITWLIHRFIK